MTKTIFLAEIPTEQAVIIADDQKEALSLLGCPGDQNWCFMVLGKAIENESSDVISRVTIAIPKQSAHPISTEPVFPTKEGNPGITLRELFAGFAMIGLFMIEANPRCGIDVEPFTKGKHEQPMAEMACGMADFLIGELQKERGA